MPMHLRRIAWFVGFATALALALWMRGAGYGWSVTIGAAVLVWIVLPLVISQLCAAFVLARIHRRMRRVDPDELASKIDGVSSRSQKHRT
jgi:uncharacterized membrane protein